MFSQFPGCGTRTFMQLSTDSRLINNAPYAPYSGTTVARRIFRSWRSGRSNPFPTCPGRTLSSSDLIGTLHREFLDHAFFPNANGLERNWKNSGTKTRRIAYTPRSTATHRQTLLPKPLADVMTSDDSGENLLPRSSSSANHGINRNLPNMARQAEDLAYLSTTDLPDTESNPIRKSGFTPSSLITSSLAITIV